MPHEISGAYLYYKVFIDYVNFRFNWCPAFHLVIHF